MPAHNHKSMRLFILGATGRIGRELVDQALKRGHLVTRMGALPRSWARRATG